MARHVPAASSNTETASASSPAASTGATLQIHHIVHWEDGGPTDTANLVALCGRTLDPTGPPRPPNRLRPPATSNRHPSGERINPREVTFSPRAA